MLAVKILPDVGYSVPVPPHHTLMQVHVHVHVVLLLLLLLVVRLLDC